MQRPLRATLGAQSLPIHMNRYSVILLAPIMSKDRADSHLLDRKLLISLDPNLTSLLLSLLIDKRDLFEALNTKVSAEYQIPGTKPSTDHLLHLTDYFLVVHGSSTHLRSTYTLKYSILNSYWADRLRRHCGLVQLNSTN